MSSLGFCYINPNGYNIFHSGSLIQKIFGPGAHLGHDPDRYGGYWLFMSEIMPGSMYWLSQATLNNFESAWQELWSIKNSMVLYRDAPVVGA